MAFEIAGTGIRARFVIRASSCSSLGLALLALGLGSCGGAVTRPERGPEARAWTYTFGIDPGLSRLDARVCFEGAVPWELVPIDTAGARYLVRAEGPDQEALPVEERRVSLLGLPDDACVRYVVDLDAAARQRGGLHGAYRIDRDLVASTAVWLWAPGYRDEEARVRARFELPEGVRVSPLWTRQPDGVHRLDERAFRFTAYSAFGRFETRHVAVPGACLRVSILGDGFEMGAESLARSLEGSATAAAMSFGRFPVPEVGVLAVPTPFSSSSPFGIVGRGTLPTVAILVGERATEARLARAWVPVHEFSHLATPFIAREHAWLSEGIATYYQEVLRARAGLQSEREAWTNLDDGFRRGDRAGTGRALEHESRDMMQTAAFRRVYWAGAAIALMADVAMRVDSGGERSLDDAIERLNACCATWDRPMTGAEAIARLDGDGPRVFGPIARRWLGSSAFPDVRETYARLGLRRTETGVELDGDDDALALRLALMAPPSALDPRPDCRP